MYPYVYVCMYIIPSIWNIYVYMYIYMCTCMYVCMYTYYIYDIYVYEYPCVCKYLWTNQAECDAVEELYIAF